MYLDTDIATRGLKNFRISSSATAAIILVDIVAHNNLLY